MKPNNNNNNSIQEGGRSYDESLSHEELLNQLSALRDLISLSQNNNIEIPDTPESLRNRPNKIISFFNDFLGEGGRDSQQETLKQFFLEKPKLLKSVTEINGFKLLKKLYFQGKMNEKKLNIFISNLLDAIESKLNTFSEITEIKNLMALESKNMRTLDLLVEPFKIADDRAETLLIYTSSTRFKKHSKPLIDNYSEKASEIKNKIKKKEDVSDIFIDSDNEPKNPEPEDSLVALRAHKKDYVLNEAVNSQIEIHQRSVLNYFESTKRLKNIKALESINLDFDLSNFAEIQLNENSRISNGGSQNNAFNKMSQAVRSIKETQAIVKEFVEKGTKLDFIPDSLAPELADELTKAIVSYKEAFDSYELEKQTLAQKEIEERAALIEQLKKHHATVLPQLTDAIEKNKKLTELENSRYKSSPNDSTKPYIREIEVVMTKTDTLLKKIKSCADDPSTSLKMLRETTTSFQAQWDNALKQRNDLTAEWAKAHDKLEIQYHQELNKETKTLSNKVTSLQRSVEFKKNAAHVALRPLTQDITILKIAEDFVKNLGIFSELLTQLDKINTDLSDSKFSNTKERNAFLETQKQLLSEVEENIEIKEAEYKTQLKNEASEILNLDKNIELLKNNLSESIKKLNSITKKLNDSSSNNSFFSIFSNNKNNDDNRHKIEQINEYIVQLDGFLAALNTISSETANNLTLSDKKISYDTMEEKFKTLKTNMNDFLKMNKLRFSEPSKGTQKNGNQSPISINTSSNLLRPPLNQSNGNDHSSPYVNGNNVNNNNGNTKK